MKKEIVLITLVTALFSGFFAIAAEKKQPRIIYKKKTSVSFDDAVVEGTGNNPEGVYVVTPPDQKMGSLLKLRPNFHRELMRDALLLK